MLFVFPRGLITILLFIAILPEAHIPRVNRSLIIQIIILTALIMAWGIIANKEEKVKKEELPQEKEEILNKGKNEIEHLGI